MNTLDDEVGQKTKGYVAQRRVNSGWITESWQLFRAQADVWITVAAISVFAPIMLWFFVTWAYGLSNAAASHINSQYAGLASNSMWYTFAHLPRELVVGLSILNVVYFAFVTGGIHALALKQVEGNHIAFTDFYSGGRYFGRMLVFTLFYTLMVGAGLVLAILPGIFAAAMLLPAFALIADGESVEKAISRSFTAMKYDRTSALALVFSLFVLIILSSFTIIGLMIVAPMVWLISSLALRDMIGLRSRLSVIDIDFVQTDRPGNFLNPEIDQSIMSTAIGYGALDTKGQADDTASEAGATLMDRAIDDHDTASPPSS